MEILDFNKLLNSCFVNFLTQNYNGDNAWSIEHKSATDVANMTNSLNILNNGELKATCKIKKNISPVAVELKSNKSGYKSLDLLVSIPQVPGLSVGTLIDNKLKAGTNFNISSQFSNQLINGRFTLEPLTQKLSLFGVKTFNPTFGTVRCGLLLDNDFKTKIINYTIAAAYEKNINNSSLKTSLKINGINYKPFNSLSSNVILSNIDGNYKKSIGAETEYFIPENKVSFTIGAQWYLTPLNSPRPTFLKAKADQDYKAEVAFTHAITDNISGTISSQGFLNKDFNAQNLKFGLKLSVS